MVARSWTGTSAVPNLLLINQGGQQGGTLGELVAADLPLPGELLSARMVELGDLDGDGDLDAVVASSSPAESNQILVNQGHDQRDIEGEFEVDDLPGANVSTSSVVLGDLEGDGDLDVLIGSSDGVRILTNLGGLRRGEEGTFDAGEMLADLGSTIDLAPGDLDGDSGGGLNPAGLPILGPGVPIAADPDWVG